MHIQLTLYDPQVDGYSGAGFSGVVDRVAQVGAHVRHEDLGQLEAAVGVGVSGRECEAVGAGPAHPGPERSLVPALEDGPAALLDRLLHRVRPQVELRLGPSARTRTVPLV